MKKQLVIIGLTLVLLVVGFSGCTKTNNVGTNTTNTGGKNNTNNPSDIERNKFVGTWKTPAYSPVENKTYYGIINFFSNGTDKVNGLNGTFDIKDGKLVLYSIDDVGVEHSTVYSYLFSENNTKLTLTSASGNEILFTKQQRNTSP